MGHPQMPLLFQNLDLKTYYPQKQKMLQMNYYRPDVKLNTNWNHPTIVSLRIELDKAKETDLVFRKDILDQKRLYEEISKINTLL